eukprot:6451940-Pyramimonas_sp.AAC.1
MAAQFTADAVGEAPSAGSAAASLPGGVLPAGQGQHGSQPEPAPVRPVPASAGDLPPGEDHLDGETVAAAPDEVGGFNVTDLAVGTRVGAEG